MSVFFLLFGLIFALTGAVIVWDYITVVRSYEIIPGKVIAFRRKYKRSRKSASYIYYPVIEFIGKGNKKEFQAKSGASWPMYDIGESVEVYYSNKYDDQRLKSVAQGIIGPIFMVVGLVICYIFWINFEMSFFSLVTAFGLSGVVAWFFGSMLRKREIKSVPDLAQEVRSLRKKVRHNHPSKDNLLTTQQELDNPDLPENKNLKFIGPVFAVIGLLAIAGAIYVGINRWNFLDRAQTAEGRVIDFKSQTDDDGTTYYPIVEFVHPPTGQSITFKHDVGSSTPSYGRGAAVPILYDPGNASHAIIDDGLWNWFATILISVIGIAFFGVGSTLTRKWWKQERFKKRRFTKN